MPCPAQSSQPGPHPGFPSHPKPGTENGFLVENDLIDTSFLLNPYFFQGSDYWDKPGWQMPVNGAFEPYDPENDPGFNRFDVSFGFITIEPEETVQQRILLSPGLNSIKGKYSLYDAGSGQWSMPVPFEEVIHNPSDMHLMEIFTLEAIDGKRTRYAALIPRCLTRRVFPEELKLRVTNELGSILELHKLTYAFLDPPPESAFSYVGIHAAGKFLDYDDLGSYEELHQSMNVPSPHAQLYLSASRSGMKAYNGMASAYALGVLSTLCAHGEYLLPYRYQFADQQWLAPAQGQTLPLSNLLVYLCDCADLSQEPDFFVAAYKVAEQIMENNWWDLNNDPEGLYFISNRFSLNASGLLRGAAILRTPQSSPGASVSSDSDDHRLLLGAAAISRFLRLFHENSERLDEDFMNRDFMERDFITDCYVAVDKSLQSFCVYADRFHLSWIDNVSNQKLLTTAWWSNYDRRDDFAGYNIGEGMMEIFLDQCRIFGYEALKNRYWVQRMFDYLDAFQGLWDENTRRGGKEASDSFRFYQCFCNVRAVEACKAWSDQYLAMYICGLMQIYKGFMNNGYPPEIGTWEISDWEPSQSVYSKEVTAPGMLFSWAADLFEISRDNQGDVQWLSTMLDIMLDAIQRTDKGEAGYEKDMSVSGDKENGGEFRLAVGLFDLLDAINDNPPGKIR